MAPTTHTPDDMTAAINSAARRMTLVSPTSDIRTRVMTRIDTPQPRAWFRWAMAGGTVAALAVAVTVTWRGAQVAQVAQVAQDRTAGPTTTPIASSPLLSTVSVKQAAMRRAAITVGTTEMEWRTRSVPALVQPDALSIGPLGHAEIGIDPIDIPPLRVAPLVVPALGDGQDR